jgi:SAM-dependent methyltransferase
VIYRAKEVIFSKFPFVGNIFAFNRYTRDRWIAWEASHLPAGSYVLDVGAGSCPYRGFFAHCRYIAQDLAQLAPDQLRGRKGYGPLDIISNINSLPIKSSIIDVVLCTEVIEHIAQPIRVMYEIARVLKPGGVLLLSAPLRSGLHQEPFHYYGGFTPYWYKKFLTEAGFTEIQITPVGGLFKAYGEESLRVALYLMLGGRQRFNLLARLLLYPFWLIMLPWFALLCPLLCYALDYLFPIENYTVGYHVKAIKHKEQS